MMPGTLSRLPAFKLVEINASLTTCASMGKIEMRFKINTRQMPQGFTGDVSVHKL